MMERSTVLAAVLTLVVAFAAPAAAGSLGMAGSPGGQVTDPVATGLSMDQQNNSSDNGSIPPGAKLAGIVSVQGAKVSGEIEQRAFGQRMKAVNSNAAKASIVAGQTSDLQARLTDIHAQQKALQQKYENGTIPQGQYKARTAKLVAEARTIQRLLDTTAATAASLPVDVLEAKGVSVQSITSLRANADTLTGPGVSKIAFEVAGKPSDATNVTSGPRGSSTAGVPGIGSNGSPGNVSVGVDTSGNISVGVPGNGTPGLGNRTGSPGNPGGASGPGNGNGTENQGVNVSLPWNSGISINETLDVTATPSF